jgi:predicted porin
MKKLIQKSLLAAFLMAASSITASAQEVNVSGTVVSRFYSFKSNGETTDLGTEVDGQGTEDSYRRNLTSFDESELKFKAKGKTPNGFNASAEVELELQGDNDFDLEEASVNLDNGVFKISAGVLENLHGSNVGAADRYAISDLSDTTYDDEEPGIRLAYIGTKGLTVSGKVVMFQAETKALNPRTKNTQIRTSFEYEQDWGKITGVYDMLSSIVEDDDEFVGKKDKDGNLIPNLDAGEYIKDANLVYFVVQPYFGKIKPFLNYGVLTNTDAEATKNADSYDTVDTGLIVGVDYEVSKNMTVSAAMNNRTQEKDEDVRDEDAKLSAWGIGMSYDMKPVTVQVGYAASSNNYSDLADGGDDYEYQGLEVGLNYSF